MELVGTAGEQGGGINGEQQVGVTLGINNNHHITAHDVGANDDLGEAGFSDTRCSQYECMTDTVAQILEERLFRFVKADRMYPGMTFQRWSRFPGVQTPGSNLEPEKAEI